MISKQYLGDGVYATVDDESMQELTLTAENGIEATNTIVFEAEVLVALYQLLMRTWPNLERFKQG